MNGSGFFSALFPGRKKEGSRADDFDDNALVKLALNGDESAFEKLIIKYKRLVRAVGSGFFKNEADIEDFIQDVYVKVFMHLSSFKAEARFSTWLTAIARNTALNAVNRRKEFVSFGGDIEIEDNDKTPEEQHMQAVTRDAIRLAMQELPEKYHVCLDLYFYCDMPYNEIAETTGIPLNTIKSNVFRAKKILHERLKELL